MSMHEALFGDYPIPEDTSRVAQAAFPKGNLYLEIRDRFGMLYHNQQFAHLFASEGRPALAPARLALVTVMQFIGCYPYLSWIIPTCLNEDMLIRLKRT